MNQHCTFDCVFTFMYPGTPRHTPRWWGDDEEERPQPVYEKCIPQECFALLLGSMKYNEIQICVKHWPTGPPIPTNPQNGRRGGRMPNGHVVLRLHGPHRLVAGPQLASLSSIQTGLPRETWQLGLQAFKQGVGAIFHSPRDHLWRA